MKKIILSMLFVFAAITASAQVYVGGAISWTHNDANKSNTFLLAPEVGYNFNEMWGVGVELAYIHTKNVTFDGTGIDAKGNGFVFAPYGRCYFFKKKIVRLFLDGGLGISTFRVKGADKSDNGFEVGFKPGIAFNVTDHLSLEAKYGFLGYRDQYMGAGVNHSVSGLDFDPNSLGFSIKYEF